MGFSLSSLSVLVVLVFQPVAPQPSYCGVSMRRKPEDMAGNNPRFYAYGQGAGGSRYDYNSRPEDRVNEVNRNLYEEENNRRVAALSEQVSLLKELTIDIGTEVRSQNSLLDGMGNSFNKTDGLMGSTMRRLNTMLKTSSGKHMLYLIAFIVFIFFMMYMMVKK